MRIKSIQLFKTCLCLILMGFSLSSIIAQSWEQLNNAPFIKHHTNGFGLSGQAYVFEGTNTENISNEIWIYTPATDSWERTGDFPGPGRSFAIGDDWNGKYYYGFGEANGTLLNDVWELDPATGAFTELPSCPCQGRYHPAFVAHNDKIFMGTGSGPNGNMQDWWEYDMITQVWTQKPNVPGGARHHPYQFSIGDFIYVGGGHRDNWHQYNPETEEWLTIDNAPGGRVAGTQFSHNDYGYVLAGDKADHSHIDPEETFMRYNSDDDLWEVLPPLPNGSRWACSSFIIDDVLYYFAGIDYDGADASVWKFDLKYLDCLPATNLNSFNVTDTSVELFWDSGEIMDSLKWRIVGETAWNFVLAPESVYALTNLESCQEYEYVLVASCPDFGANSDIGTFKTDGCCENPEITVSINADADAELEWNDVLGIETYELRWKAEEESTWMSDIVTESNYVISGLVECTKYEVQIKSTCASIQMDFSESQVFLSKGCGACTDAEFCNISTFLDGQDAYINEVIIEDYVNNTGTDGGYGNFVVEDPEIFLIGSSFNLTVEPVFGTLPLNMAAFIDFDGNGDYSGPERVFLVNGLSSTINREIQIPDDAVEGISRMRIVYSKSWPVDACSSDANSLEGEAEDYCIELTNTSSLDDKDYVDDKIKVYPNPFNNSVYLKGNFEVGETRNLSILSVTGETIRYIENFDLSGQLDLSLLTSGIYFLRIENENNRSKLLKLIKQ